MVLLNLELYLYSPYGPYGLYRASVPVQGWPLPLPFYLPKKPICVNPILDKNNSIALLNWNFTLVMGKYFCDVSLLFASKYMCVGLLAKQCIWRILNTQYDRHSAGRRRTKPPGRDVTVSGSNIGPETDVGDWVVCSFAQPLQDKSRMVDCVWNVMAHAQKPDFVFRRNGRVYLKREARQFSRVLAAEVCASAVVMLDTHNIAR